MHTLGKIKGNYLQNVSSLVKLEQNMCIKRNVYKAKQNRKPADQFKNDAECVCAYKKLRIVEKKQGD